jgi:DNA-binding protein WhiA
MAMTSAVKDELARVALTKSCCRKAEVSSLLRFAGGLHLVAGNIVVEVEVDANVGLNINVYVALYYLLFTHVCK